MRRQRPFQLRPTRKLNTQALQQTGSCESYATDYTGGRSKQRSRPHAERCRQAHGTRFSL